MGVASELGDPIRSPVEEAKDFNGRDDGVIGIVIAFNANELGIPNLYILLRNINLSKAKAH